MRDVTETTKSDRLSFKEMCAKFDVTPRTLRYYEYIELLEPEKEGRTRWYTPREVARMTLIMRGRRFGFSLEELRQWLLIYDEQGSEAQNRIWVQNATNQLAKLDEQIADLREARDELEALRDQVKAQLGED
ncbi:MerR family DNA-binding transcriptional regulator [uncultured Maritimibacter sp.]|jgi:DNA-binding transcriptional MerR regulator|uniref:MerR family transcriptional regulator n=1 Tax=uncultured Maritimibacter sp. TaxID=991866 RepID=UPI000A9BD31E|nr:MerR family DNA-binding transcriptional regulator [uncultured Maritimibacter sp.]